MKKNTIRKIWIIIIYLICIYLLNYYLNFSQSKEPKDALISLNIAIIALVIIQILISKLSNIKIVSISGFFIIFNYVFYFSQSILLLLSYDFGDLAYSIARNKYGDSIFFIATKFSLLCIAFVFLGMLFINAISRQSVKRFISNDYSKLRKQGIMLFVISFPIDIYIVISQILAMFNGGYSNVHEVSVNLLLKYLSYLLLPGIFLIIVSHKNSSKRAKLIFIIFIVYKLISMMTGLRAYNLMNIIIVVYLYYNIIEKVNLIELIKVFISGYLGLYLIMAIRSTRNLGISITSIVNTWKSTGNIFLSTLSEFGMTINVVCESLVSIGEYARAPFAGGKQILTSFLGIVPKVTDLFPSIHFNEYNLIKKLDIWNMGGSYIADFYFDFGKYSIISMVIYGGGIMILSQYIKEQIENEQYFKIAILLPLVIEILFTVRTTITKIPRILVWIPLFIIILDLIIRKLKFIIN